MNYDFKIVKEHLDSMTDEEFEIALKEAGIDTCTDERLFYKDNVWFNKLGRFNITFDSQNVGLGFEIDWSEPFSIDINLPFVKFGWSKNYDRGY